VFGDVCKGYFLLWRVYYLGAAKPFLL